MVFNLKESLLEQPLVYYLWQRPFIDKKIAPLKNSSDLWKNKTVLDVGCGPGTNTKFFKEAKHYTGIDINPSYISKAEKLFPKRNFICHDVSKNLVLKEKPDLIFCNSLLHHLSDNEVLDLLSWLKIISKSNVDIVLIDLLLPNKRGIPYFLAKADRGDFPRTMLEWESLLKKKVSSLHLEPFNIGLSRLILWNLVHIKGKI